MSSQDATSTSSVPEKLVVTSPDEAIPRDSGETLEAAASDSPLNEDQALTLLKQNDLPPEVFEQLSKNGAVNRSRKVKLAIVEHPRTPRYVSLAILRHLFTFDLMRVALTSIVAGDVRMAAEEVLINRLESISSGEKLSLARRASGRVAGALLTDKEPRVMRAALENSRMTEALVVKALTVPEAPAALVCEICVHPKWSLRQEIRVALLRNESTPLKFAQEFARTLPLTTLKEILETSRLPQDVKDCLLKTE
jgi:hypothetical protein